MFLPDGTHYLYMAANFSGQKGVDAIFVGSLDSNEKRFVVEATANAAYAEPRYLLFYHDNTVFAQRFAARPPFRNSSGSTVRGVKRAWWESAVLWQRLDRFQWEICGSR